ncbi:hypothetical protein EC930055_5345, partial [Escherichia coli 93.0055]
MEQEAVINKAQSVVLNI